MYLTFRLLRLLRFVAFRLSVVLVFSYLAIGCSGRAVKDSLSKEGLVPPVVVRTSIDDKRPSWVKYSVSEADGKVYFSGGFLNGADYSVTIRCANAEALKSAASSISQYIRVEFSSFVQGDNGIGGIDRYINDGVAVFSKNIHVQGIRQAEVYYEEVWHSQMMQSMYNAFVRLEMDRADYLHAKADVLRKLHDQFHKAGEVEAKRKAEDLLRSLKDEIST